MTPDNVVNTSIEVAGLCLIFVQLCVTMYYWLFAVNIPKVVYLEHDKTIPDNMNNGAVLRLKKKTIPKKQ